MPSSIEWLKSADGKEGYTLNPVKGLCPVACPYCYAARMYKRFKWNPEIRFAQWDNPGVFDVTFPKGSKVFIGSTMELFGEWIKPEWMQTILWWCRNNPDQTFIFLTKRPENLAKWSPFPENCWVGASVTNAKQLSQAYLGLKPVKATVKFISFEPLLDNVVMPSEYLIDAGINWVIIGAQTPFSVKTAPKVEWIKEIVEAAGKARIPVFLKNNLVPRGACCPGDLLRAVHVWPRRQFPKLEVSHA